MTDGILYFGSTLGSERNSHFGAPVNHAFDLFIFSPLVHRPPLDRLRKTNREQIPLLPAFTASLPSFFFISFILIFHFSVNDDPLGRRHAVSVRPLNTILSLFGHFY